MELLGAHPSNGNGAAAEAEHARSGGDFDEIVQRLWGEARRTLEVQRRHEAREEAWAQKSDL